MPEILMVNLKPADGGEKVSKEFMRIFLDFSHMNSARSSLDFWLKATPFIKTMLCKQIRQRGKENMFDVR
jgi:hypothetical protein